MAPTIGLVGCGRWGSHHLRILNELKSTGRIQRVVVCDIDADKRREIQADAVYASLDEMLNGESLDGLAIVTPPETHVGLARQGLAHGLPLLVEKPLAANAAEADSFLTSLDETTVMVVGYILRHHHGIARLHSDDVRASLGKIQSVKYLRTTTRKRPPKAYPIATLGVHALDLISWFLDRPLMSGEVVSKVAAPDSASVNLAFPSGQNGGFEVAWSASEEQRLLHVNGTTGQASLDFGSGLLTLNTNGASATLQSTGEEPLLAEWNHFLHHIQRGHPYVFPPVDRLHDQSMWLHAHGGEDSL